MRWLQRILHRHDFRAVAVMEQPVHWADVDVREKIHWTLLECPCGKRDYIIADRGYCRTYKKYRDYMAGVNVWLHGGPLPRTATPVGPVSPTPFKVIDGGAA